MRKSVASTSPSESGYIPHPPMLNGTFNPAFFRTLQDLYVTRTGYNLVLSDTNGSIQMGLPDCEKFPCMRSCRDCREHIVKEALRTGKVCIDTCHEDYILWGLPFAINGKTVGGLIVIGGEQVEMNNRGKFQEACAELFKLMQEHQILPDMVSPESPDFSNVHRFLYRKTFAELNEKLETSGRGFIRCLQTAEFKEAEHHFKCLREAFEASPFLPLDLLRGLMGDLIYLAKRQCVDAGMDAYSCLSEAGFLLEKVSAAADQKDIIGILDLFRERMLLLSRQRPKDPDDLLIEKATTYLEEHIREELTRESVAKAVGISPSHFSRLIREKKGRTFTDLLNQYRIERASKLLVRSTNTLAQIANETGFCDQSYFSKVFRRYKAMSPAKYREEHQL
ncbi:MAG TPA: helix-turn-helix domain-containing protein [Oceanipulchritudo sp.]|nr:helix-turn-helix domain-containing protein [Oceanipulchritudo sp.]